MFELILNGLCNSVTYTYLITLYEYKCCFSAVKFSLKEIDVVCG